jgi:flagellar biosynthesis protein FlhF
LNLVKIQSLRGKQYKFVVGSAEEAVKILRERLGEDARVVSVRQVEGEGLARFLRTPRLEVIAQVGSAAPPPDLAPAPAPSPPLANIGVQTGETKATAGETLERILCRGGLSEAIVGRLAASEWWEKTARMPLGEALTEVAVQLRALYQRNPRRPTGNCVAFIGTAGAGKTTALCKRLANEVFFKQRQAVVLKVDMDRANPGDGLAVFCDVLGVPMVRSISNLPQLEPDITLYIDFPGISAEQPKEVSEMARHLAAVPATSRVLVVNSAYETALIRQAFRMGSNLEATHVVFTHLDELSLWGKLWEFILGPQSTPLFLSSGQNIAGDFTEAIFDSLLDRSFPAFGKEVAMQGASL